MTGPGGKTSTRQVNAAGQTTGLTGGPAAQTINYSVAGDMSGATTGDQSVTLERDANGRESVVTLSDGRVVRYGYDDAGRRVLTILPDGTRRTTTFDAAGQQVGRAEGATGESREYDAAGRLTAATGPDGLTTRYSHDVVGNLTQVSDGLGGTATFQYDEANRLVAATDAVGRVARSGYDLSGNLVSRTDFMGETWTYQYDAANRRVAATDATGATTRFTYDGQSLWDGTTDPLGRATTLAFSTDGQLARRTLPLGQTERLTYEDRSRLVGRKDFGGRLSAYAYDGAGRLAAVTDPDGTRQFEYDAEGGLAAVTDPRGRTAIQTDGTGRVTAWAGPAGSATSFAYSAGDGMPVRVTTGSGPAALTSTRTFDPATHYLTGTADPFGGATAYSPDPSGLTVGVRYPGGVTAATARDALGRPMILTYAAGDGSVLLRLDYRYDANGRIDRVTEAGGPTTDYAYDTAGRLTAESVTSGGSTRTTRYEYDAAANLTRRTDPAGTATAFAADANDRLTGDGTWTYHYTDAGDLVRRTSAAATESFTYDARDRLVRVERTGAGAFDVRYAYDADGLLAERRDAAGVVRYVWDRSTALPQLLEERDGSGALLRRYESNGVAVTQVIDADGSRRLLLTDAQGSPRLVVTAGGQVVGRPGFDAYGRSTGGGLVGFTNGLADPLTGLVFLRSRWYAPALARFVTPDSAPVSQDDPQSVNRYAYVQGDPVNRTDPTGQELFTLTAIAVTIGLITLASAGLTIVGGVVSAYRGGGGVFSSYREMSKNLRSYHTGGAVGIGTLNGIFGAEYATFDPDKSTGIFFTFGGQIAIPVKAAVSPYISGLYDTPRPENYEGFFWSYGVGPLLSIPVGLKATGEQNPVTLVGGVNIAWSPTPTFYSDGNGHFRAEARTGYQARYSHTIAFSPVNIASLGVNYYFLLLRFGQSWSDTRIVPDFFFGHHGQLGTFVLG